MRLRVWSVVPALTAGLLWGCGGSDTESNAGSSGQAGGSSIGDDSSGGGDDSSGVDDDGINLGDSGATGSCPSTCEALNADCGTVTDSDCGGVVECGTCANGELCGAAGPNRCGAGEVICTPTTCSELDADCGAVSDGCGELLDCGSCETGETCGTLTPNRCDVGTSCTPLSCADLAGVECGIQSDGCGGTLDCGSCANGEECVTLDGQSQCIAPPVCTPLTCEELGVECGLAGDGCSGTLDCGNSCVSPKICGGDPEEPGKCGCTGVCSQIPDCGDGTTTSISGTVFDPGGRNPLYNALVYIPNNPADPGLEPFETRTNTCDVCGATAAGDPLVSAQTGVDGTFTLTGVPVGDAVTLVVQLGRWRRIFEVDIPTACEANELPNAGKLTLPKNKSEGDIPHIASVTGGADGMECMLWKAGIDTAEFTNPSGTGRVHLYQGSGYDGGDGTGPGTRIDVDTPSETELYNRDTSGHMPLTDYDMLILACQGSDYGRDVALQPALAYWEDLVDYANNGGRVFATHWSHAYMRIGGADNPLYSTATWRNPNDYDYPTDYTGTIVNDPDMNPREADFNAWLEFVDALNTPIETPATFDMFEPRFDVSSVTAPGQTWITAPPPREQNELPLHYTFNTPVSDGTGESCGRFVYSDFHVSKGNPKLDFPANCGAWENFTAQEKVLEFMLFDLSACVIPYVPLCTPTTCAAQGIECGAAGDGCGAALDCGVCEDGETCGLVSPGLCGAFTCMPTTCDALGYECGAAGDGCGAALDCGVCENGEICGAGGPNKCGTATCTPSTCAEQELECGMAGDGCGAALDCGDCEAPAVCGLGGPGKCGTPSCTPSTCEEQGLECGAAGDGCGAALDCGNCSAGEVCGLSEPGKCGVVS